MLFGMNNSQAQIFEVGPFIGGSNFIGDVGATTYIRPNSPAVGLIGKWNRSLRHSWRATVIYSPIKADDAQSNQERRKTRGYQFTNNLLELSAGMEFNFWEWDIYSSQTAVVPYLYTGISGFMASDFYKKPDQGQLEKKSGNKLGLAIPMTIGIKGRLSRSLTLSMEIGARFTFSDNLDGSTPSEFGGKDILDKQENSNEDFYEFFGNQNSNDWYLFTGISLTYNFGRKTCYDVY